MIGTSFAGTRGLTWMTAAKRRSIFTCAMPFYGPYIFFLTSVGSACQKCQMLSGRPRHKSSRIPRPNLINLLTSLVLRTDLVNVGFLHAYDTQQYVSIFVDNVLICNNQKVWLVVYFWKISIWSCRELSRPWRRKSKLMVLLLIYFSLGLFVRRSSPCLSSEILRALVRRTQLKNNLLFINYIWVCILAYSISLKFYRRPT